MTLPMLDHWDPDKIPWLSLLGQRVGMDGGDAIIMGVEVSPPERTFTLTVRAADDVRGGQGGG